MAQPNSPDPRILAALQRLRDGDQEGGAQLALLLYDELRRMARGMLGRDRNARSLQPTALVHEAWIRLACRETRDDFEGRGEFLRYAARVMHNVLVDEARRRQAKRRASPGRVDLDRVTVVLSPTGPDPVDLLDLEDALERLRQRDAELVSIVEMRYFAGMTLEETAEAIGKTVRQIRRSWDFARAWLLRELRKGSTSTSPEADG